MTPTTPRRLSFLFGVLLALAGAAPAWAFSSAWSVVRVPGNCPELANWSEVGAPAMTLVADQTWEAFVTFGAAKTIQYKLAMNNGWAQNRGSSTTNGAALPQIAAGLSQNGANISLGVPAGTVRFVFLENQGLLYAEWTLGRFQIQPNFPNSFGLQKRNVRVFLPADYHTSSLAYPVVYLHDGQNVFDAFESSFGEWRVDEQADALVAQADAVRPAIYVGIWNTPERLDEYSTLHPKAVAYRSFIASDLKPWIDARYRTLPGPADTAIVGSSLGGLVAAWQAWTQPDVFGLCGAVSPSFWYENGAFLAAVEAYAGPKLAPRYWVYAGSQEGSNMAANARRFVAKLRAVGWRNGRDVRAMEEFAGLHNESWWAAQMDNALLFLLGRHAFYDSFEAGQWNNQWAESGTGGDWQTPATAVHGAASARAQGSTIARALEMTDTLDLRGAASATLRFRWALGSAMDAGENLRLDFFHDGVWHDGVLTLRGDLDPEGVWSARQVDLASYLSKSDFKLRFTHNSNSSAEYGYVDFVTLDVN